MTVRVHPLDPMAPEQLEAVVTIDAHAFLTPRPDGELREAYDRMLGIARILLAQHRADRALKRIPCASNAQTGTALEQCRKEPIRLQRR